MKLLALALIPLASAALLGRQSANPPDCFRVCFTEAMSNPEGCSTEDVACFCANQHLISVLSACVQRECKAGAEVDAAAAFGVAYCKAGGVDITPSITSFVVPTSSGTTVGGAGNGGSTVVADSTGGTATASGIADPTRATTAVDSSVATAIADPTHVEGSITTAPGPIESATATSSPAQSTAINASSTSKPSGASASSAATSATTSAKASQTANSAAGVVPQMGLVAGLLAVVFAL